jgi:hypothetical protein
MDYICIVDIYFEFFEIKKIQISKISKEEHTSARGAPNPLLDVFYKELDVCPHGSDALNEVLLPIHNNCQ